MDTHKSLKKNTSFPTQYCSDSDTEWACKCNVSESQGWAFWWKTAHFADVHKIFFFLFFAE